MKKLLVFLTALVCLSGFSFAQTKIDLSKQKGVVPVLNGGTGNAGQLSVSTTPGDLSFGTVQVGTPSPAQNAAISNTGSNPVTINTVLISGTGAAHFSTSTICVGEIIDGGATCVEQVQYNPASAIAETAQLTVTTSAPVNPSNPLVVALAGTGTGSVSYPVSVNGAGTGSGIIVSDEATPLINCTIAPPAAPSGKCSSNYATGSTPVLTVTPAAGSTLASLSGGGCSTSPCTLNVTAATNITATFNLTPPNVALNLSGIGGGTGNVTSDTGGLNCKSKAGLLTGTCSASFPQGTVVTLTEVPGISGADTCVGGACTFGGWGGVSGCAAATTCVVTMNNLTNVSANFIAPAVSAPVAFIQSNTPAGGTLATATNTSSFSAAQTAGNFNVVHIAWGDVTRTVSSVTDSKGNTYTQLTTSSCSPKQNSDMSEAVYYSANIAAAAAGTNTLTVVFSAAPTNVGYVYAEEYSGIATSSPVDVCSAGTGLGTALNSGNLVTTVAGDLLTAGNIVDSNVSVVSPNWTQRIASSGNDTEDRIPGVTGTFSNTATQSGSNRWISIAAAWKPGSGGGSGTSVNFNVVGGGSGSGTLTGSGINCTISSGVATGTCSTTVPVNSTLTLNATPTGASSFTNYQGAGCGSLPTCTTSPLTVNTSLTANFNLAGVATFYASTAGSGTACTSGAPCTIQQAIATANLGASGTLVDVGCGTYTLTRQGSAGNYAAVNVNKAGGGANQRFVLKSHTQYCAIIKVIDSAGGGNGISIAAPWVDVIGFAVTSNSASDFACTGIDAWSGATNSRAIGNKVYDFPAPARIQGQPCFGNGGGGIATDGAPNNFTADSNIIDNIGYGSGGSPPTCNTVHGLYGSGSNDVFTNNQISRACGWGIQAYHVVTNYVISNNTVFNNDRGGMILDTSSGSFATSTIANNILFKNGLSGGTSFGASYGIRTNAPVVSSTLISRNLLIGNGPTNFGNFGSPSYAGNFCDVAQTGCATVITSAQALSSNLFVNYTGDRTGDMRLKVGAIGINNGGTQCATGGQPGCVPLIDFLGIARPQGPAYDIGAFEQ